MNHGPIKAPEQIQKHCLGLGANRWTVSLARIRLPSKVIGTQEGCEVSRVMGQSPLQEALILKIGQAVDRGHDGRGVTKDPTQAALPSPSLSLMLGLFLKQNDLALLLGIWRSAASGYKRSKGLNKSGATKLSCKFSA